MPPVTEGPKMVQSIDKSGDGGVKDFSRRYLKEGMWPGKVQEYYQQRQSMDVTRQSANSTTHINNRPSVQVLNQESSKKVETRIKPYNSGALTERLVVAPTHHKQQSVAISRTLENFLPHT